MTNFVAAGSHLKKKESDYTCSDSLSGLPYELFYSASFTNFSYQLSVEVSRTVTMPPKRTIESFITAASERSCQHIENETAANEGKIGVKVINMLGGGGLIKMECPILFQPPLLFVSLRRRCDLCNVCVEAFSASLGMICVSAKITFILLFKRDHGWRFYNYRRNRVGKSCGD